MTEPKKRASALQVVVSPEKRRLLRIRAAEQMISVSELMRRMIDKELTDAEK
jgi:predicted HicB family RNase H-like nuclease